MSHYTLYLKLYVLCINFVYSDFSPAVFYIWHVIIFIGSIIFLLISDIRGAAILADSTIMCDVAKVQLHSFCGYFVLNLVLHHGKEIRHF